MLTVSASSATLAIGTGNQAGSGCRFEESSTAGDVPAVVLLSDLQGSVAADESDTQFVC